MKNPNSQRRLFCMIGLSVGQSLTLKRVILLMISLFLLSCEDDDISLNNCSEVNLLELSESQKLFYDLAFNQEFGDDTDRLRKWSSNISFFVEGNPSQELRTELQEVIDQINNLNITYGFVEIDERPEADLIIFFGTSEDYVELIEPEARGFAEGTRGFTSIFWNSTFEITRASVCIDYINFPNFEILKHVIREEVAQSLGLINDTVLNNSSIFHQNIRNETYSESDLYFIEEMLSNNLLPGYCPNETFEIIE